MTEKKRALVLSGGGARGAYEAGILYQLRQTIWPKTHGFHIHSGTSAGAINTCFLAATAEDPQNQAIQMRRLWETLTSDHIYRGDFRALYHFLGRALSFTTTHFLGLAPLVKKLAGDIKPFQGLLDTSPFIPFLKSIIPFKQIRKNIREGQVDAVVIGTTNIGNGKLELFVDKKESLPYAGPYKLHEGPIYFTHALASAAIPLVFPPVRIGPYFYVDGGIRQNTPMNPALQLGAEKILIIGVKYKKSKTEFRYHEANAYPTFTHMSGKLLSTLFLEHIDYDLEQLERINQIIEVSETIYGPDYLEKLNQHLNLKKIETVSLFPSIDLGKIACDRLLELSRTKQKLNPVERFFLKFLEIDPEADLDLLSYLMFEKEYLGRLIEIGIADCRERESELQAFLTTP